MYYIKPLISLRKLKEKENCGQRDEKKEKKKPTQELFTKE